MHLVLLIHSVSELCNCKFHSAALDHHAYKNRLQELAHKSSIPIPTYSTVNEGLGHLPRFRATVFVDGKSYTSPNTFLHRKEAEQDVARIAYEVLLQKVNNEEIPPVHEVSAFLADE